MKEFCVISEGKKEISEGFFFCVCENGGYF